MPVVCNVKFARMPTSPTTDWQNSNMNIKFCKNLLTPNYLRRVKPKNFLRPFYYSNPPRGSERFYALPIDLGDRVLDFGAFGFHGLFVVHIAL